MHGSAQSGLVLLTRVAEDNERLGRHLDQLGVRWASLPCIALETAEPDRRPVEAVESALPLSAAAFTSRWSVKGLRALADRMEQWQLKSESCLTAAVGPSTAKELETRGFRVNLVADPPTAASLGRALAARLEPGAAVLVPQGDRPRPELTEILAEANLRVLPLQVYRHKPVELGEADLPCPIEEIRVVVCASPSAADNLLRAFPVLADRRFAAMGPTTETRLRSLGAGDVSIPERTDPRALAERAAGLL